MSLLPQSLRTRWTPRVQGAARPSRAAGAGLLLAALMGGLVGGGAAPATAAAATDLRVGSFNLSNVTFDTSAGGDHRPWRERRGVVAQQILGQRLDVVGVQEANPSTIYQDRLVSGTTQFADLRNALNERGGNYALANSWSYNCQRSTSSKNCTYVDRGSALSNRILYDTDTLSLVSQGSLKYTAQSAGKYDRYLEWAVLKTRSTGREFLFTNTHLDPYSTTNRAAQWKQAVDKTVQLRGTRPVVAVGDYNSTKYSAWSQKMLPYTSSKGFGDVVGQTYATNPVARPRAESSVNGWYHSFNRWNTDASTWSFATKRTKSGNNIDWIFATNSLRVKQWEVVADVDPTTLRARGILPSDHNLVRATVVLP